MQFQPFVYDKNRQQVPVTIEPMSPQDAISTGRDPLWQTSWTSEFLADSCFEKYSARHPTQRGIAAKIPKVNVFMKYFSVYARSIMYAGPAQHRKKRHLLKRSPA